LRRQTTPPRERRSREIWLSSGSLDLPTLLIDRHANDLGHDRWRLGVLGRAEAEVIEDLLDGYLVVELGNDLERLSRLLRGAISAHSIGIVAVKERAMLPRVRDVIRQSRQPFQRNL